MSDKPEVAPGRTPPPPEHRFLKGTSGNKRGRPKGPSLKKLTRKVALRKHRLGPEGPAKTLLQHVIEAMIRGAASGVPSMVALNNEIRAKIRPQVEKQQGGLPCRARRSVARGIYGESGKAKCRCERSLDLRRP
jgi:hypothetical protein